MPKVIQEKIKCVDDLRHAEYYGMQTVFDDLYVKSKNGDKFDNLMELILCRENILLAYRNIKTNTGSNTAGTDKLTISDIGRLSPDEVVEFIRFIVTGKHGYRPKPVRRKDIPKPNGSTRPLGIPCIWDRLVQQCIKQIMEPICEAKFSDNSYGFRPCRCVEHAISKTYKLMQISNLHYIIEFDIMGFFDNVNHSKLIKQIWAMGIHDKHLIYVLKQILTASIKMSDGTIIKPDKGTPQGGIISPLLANVVLNELDHWVESQWQNNPLAIKYSTDRVKKGIDKGHAYRKMRRTELKEMYIVRYADDFRIFCRSKDTAEKTKIAITQWISERLKLDVSEEKTKIVNVKRRYSEFLGFKLKMHKQGGKHVVKSHMCDKALKRSKEKLLEQAKRIAKPEGNRTDRQEVRLYNSMVMGMHNYYRIATGICMDCDKIQRVSMTVLTNRLGRKGSSGRLVKHGRELTKAEKGRYGKSERMRYIAGSYEPIYPVGYVQHRNPMMKKQSICAYTVEGRVGLHDNLRINTPLMHRVMLLSPLNKSTEFADNRISLFSAQWGKCAITQCEFLAPCDIYCHHKIPIHNGGTDKYENLVLVLEPVHILIHATKQETIFHYMEVLHLNKEQLNKLNKLRELAGVNKINV